MQSWACPYEDCRGDNTIGVSGVILDVFARYEPPQRRRNAAESPHRPDVVVYQYPAGRDARGHPEQVLHVLARHRRRSRAR